MPDYPTDRPSLNLRSIYQTWWPLAASWVLMGAEVPALSAVVARLPHPEIHLAAYGGVVFPLALIIESPVIMLLAASTALSKDWDSYRKVRRFMLAAAAILTGFHILVAFTPLYYVIVRDILGAPEEIIAPARIGLMIMTPWSGSIAFRRFNQGVLIRFNRSRAVSIGTAIRLSADALVLAVGYILHDIPGIVVATSAVAAGVICEAIYAGIVTRPVIRRELRQAPPVVQPITVRSFLNFYVPLAMTSLLFLLVQPIGSAALSRMPLALYSLAAWPVVTGLVFMLRSLGVAYNEVVVAILDIPGSVSVLRRFTVILSVSVTVLLLVIVATPLSRLWFLNIQGLPPDLAHLAVISLWIALPLPGLNALQSWYQGSIVHSRHTRGITEAVVVFLVTCFVVLIAGVLWGEMTGLYVGMAAFSLALLTQTIWLERSSRRALATVIARDRDHHLATNVVQEVLSDL